MKGKLETQFTEDALHILKTAEIEAVIYPRADGKTGTEHLLLALFATHPTLNFLSGWLGISRDEVRTRLHQMAVATGLEEGKTHDLSLHLQQVIKIALQEKIARNHSQVAPHHLLFALTQAPDCTAMTFIRDFGIGSDELQRQIARLMRYGSRPNPQHPRVRDALLLYEDLIADSTEFHKWDFKCVLIESASNEVISHFKVNGMDIWGLRYGIEKGDNQIEFERKIEINQPNPKYHLVISLEEAQP